MTPADHPETMRKILDELLDENDACLRCGEVPADLEEGTFTCCNCRVARLVQAAIRDAERPGAAHDYSVPQEPAERPKDEEQRNRDATLVASVISRSADAGVLGNATARDADAALCRLLGRSFRYVPDAAAERPAWSKVGSPEHVEFWVAVNEYAEACGGNTAAYNANPRRMDAVVRVEGAAKSWLGFRASLAAAERSAGERLLELRERMQMMCEAFARDVTSRGDFGVDMAAWARRFADLAAAEQTVQIDALVAGNSELRRALTKADARARAAAERPQDAPRSAEPTCPLCRRALRRVRQDSGSMLNAEQFDAGRAGDWYCETCPPHPERKTRANVRYWWDHELIGDAPTSETVASRGPICICPRPGVLSARCPVCDPVEGPATSAELRVWDCRCGERVEIPAGLCCSACGASIEGADDEDERLYTPKRCPTCEQPIGKPDVVLPEHWEKRADGMYFCGARSLFIENGIVYGPPYKVEIYRALLGIAADVPAEVKHPPQGWTFEGASVSDDTCDVSLADAETLLVGQCDGPIQSRVAFTVPIAAIEFLTGRRLVAAAVVTGAR